MEISPVEFDDYEVYSNNEPRFADWEKVGRVALIGFSIVACGAFIPAFIKKKRSFSPIMADVPIPPEPTAEPEALRPILPAPRCTDIERPKVEEIFKTVAGGGANLVFSGFRLVQLGDEIDHVHPFSFLLAAPKEHVRTIFYSGSGFTIAGVMKGVKKGMEREYARKNLDRYIPDFAAAFGKDPEAVRPLIRARSWRSLVHYLFEINVEHED